MSLVILPTFEILTENLTYDNMYGEFIPGGVRAVIRDAVFQTSFKERSPTQDYYSSLQSHHSALVDYVLKRYDEYTQNRVNVCYDDEGPDTLRLFDLGEYLSVADHLELITNNIEGLVHAMMEDLFRTKLYHIVERRSYWKDRDLVIRVESFPFGGKGRGF